MIHEKIEIQLKDSEFTANLFTYFLDNSPEIDPERKRPVVLICPGGGYAMTSDREAEALAVKFMAMGYHAAILRYSVAPARFPEALLQLATAVAMLRENAEKWHIDTDKIVIQGSSAGGHLAASLGVFWNKPFVAEALEMDAEKVPSQWPYAQLSGNYFRGKSTSGVFRMCSWRRLCRRRKAQIPVPGI